MAKLAIKLNRKIAKRVSKIPKQVDWIITRALGGNRGHNWRLVSKNIRGPITLPDGLYQYNVLLVFERHRGTNNADIIQRQANDIVQFVEQAANNAKFKEFPYNVENHTIRDDDDVPTTVPAIPRTHAPTPLEMAVRNNGTVPGVAPVVIRPEEGDDDNAADLTDFNDDATPLPRNDQDVITFEEAVPLEDVDIPEVLISGTDEEIEAHPAFQGIYGRTSHIRVIASSMKSFKESNGARRNHIVMHGLPACAKSRIMRGFMEMLGGTNAGSFIAINADSTTKAGIETMFLNRLKQTGIPPFVFVEELEKTIEAVLTIWLGMLDDRREIRKINYRQQDVVKTNILCVSTVNDKIAFDRMMGGRPGKPGALSSRFVKQLYVPRPDKDIMRRILQRDIEINGGNQAWVDAAIELSEEIKTNDPRMILGFLDGQDRLLTGEYQKDVIKIYELETKERKEGAGEFVGIDQLDVVQH